MPPSPLFTPTTGEGWVQFAGDAQWSPARFSTAASSGRAELRVERPHVDMPTIVALHDVTALDELDGAPTGCHHIELAVDRRPTLQAVWPESFSGAVVAALATTVSTSTVDDEPAPIEAVGTIGRPRPARRLTSVGTIGALALAGCGALIVGFLGLRDTAPDRPSETAVLTQTTIRGPIPTTTGVAHSTTTTLAEAPTSTDRCDASPTTTAPAASMSPPSTTVGCEPG